MGIIRPQNSLAINDRGLVSVVSLNACLWPPGLRNTKNWPMKDPRCIDISAVFSCFDICVSQEVLAWPYLFTVVEEGCKWRNLISKAVHHNRPPLFETHYWAAVDPSPWNVLLSAGADISDSTFVKLLVRFNIFAGFLFTF
jgi:hypothetical protein